jgi:hypothetical protein
VSEEPQASAPAKKARNEPRYVVLLVLTVVGTLVGGLLASVAMGALFSFMPPLVAVLVGTLFGFALPIFLALRAAAALKRRNMPALLRRLVVMGLIGATQLAVVGGVLTWTSRGTGELAATAHAALGTFGGVPVISGLLENHATKSGALIRKKDPAPGPDAGVLADAGPVDAADGGVAVVDAGTAPALAATGPEPRPPAPKPGATLSPRSAGGALTARVVDLAAHEKRGAPTLVECADDGAVAAILDGVHLLVVRPGKPVAEVVKALAPGQRLGELEIRGTRDVVIAPGGSMLAVVEVLVEGGGIAQRLVSVPKTGPVVVLRSAGDAVPQGSDGSVAHTWAFKRHNGSGSVLVVETYLEGGNDVGTRIGGEQYTLNPQRLLAMKIDAPKAQLEVTRTGTEPNGIDGMELQAFGDASLLADGRALFDANFIERGAEGWLFLGRVGEGVFALAPELRGGGAPWSQTPPRAMYLDAVQEGTVIFRRGDGAVVSFALDAPKTASASLLGADALDDKGNKRGSITNVDVPLLARGGEWIVASATMAGKDAIVLASSADRANGVAEVVLAAGDALPNGRKVQSIRLGRGREELLWRR